MLPSHRPRALLALLACAALCFTGWLAFLVTSEPAHDQAASTRSSTTDERGGQAEVALQSIVVAPRARAPEPLETSPGLDSSGPEPSPPAEDGSPAAIMVLVSDEPGQPLAGATLRVRVPGREDLGPLALGTSDEHGTSLLELPGLEGLHPLELSLASLELNVCAAGFRPRTVRVEGSSLRRGPRELTVVLQPGARLHGRVLDEGGAPAPGALIGFYARERGGDGSEVQVLFGTSDAGGRLPSERVVGRTVSDAAGNYEFAHEGREDTLSVRARHESRGDGGLDHVGLAPIGDQRLADIVLRPSGLLSGQVLLADGFPAGGVAVTSRLVARPDGDEQGLSLLVRPAVVTDAAGRFTFARLEHGVHQLAAGDPDLLRDGFVPAPNQRFATGTRGIELRADCALLRVRVVTAEGRALRAVQVTLLVIHATPDGSLEAGRRRQAVTVGARPHASFALEPGAQVLLRVTLDGCHRSQRLFTLPGVGVRFDEELRVHSLSSQGRLAPRVLDAGGQDAREYRLFVFDPYSRRRVGAMHRAGPDASGESSTIALPPGRWLLDARADAGPIDAAELEPGRGVAVELEPDVTTRVELRLP